MRRQQPARGALYVALSSLLFAGMGVCVRLAGRELPNEMVVFFRNAGGLLCLSPWLLRRGEGLGPRALATRCPHLHLLRALAGLSAMYCFFYALGRLPLAEAILLNYTMPLFIPLVAWLWLREPVTPGLAAAAVVGFAGLLLILRPGAAPVSPAALAGLVSGLFGAVAMVSIRRLTRTEPTFRIVFYFALVATAVSAVPLAWAWEPPPPRLWPALAGSGLFATAGQLFLTRGYASAPAAQVGPFVYLAVVFAGLMGWAAWGEVPEPSAVAGMALVAVAGGVALRARAASAAAPGRR
ncbi:MAG: DMT family transporter [Nitrospirae bacterium]|nr:MAG: DMT family transporter [Nitrospirota bacterium]